MSDYDAEYEDGYRAGRESMESYCQDLNHRFKLELSSLQAINDSLMKPHIEQAMLDPNPPIFMTETELPEGVVLNGNPADWEANFNMRDWVTKAVEAKGAKFTGGGTCAEYSDIDIELEGMKFNIQITPRINEKGTD